MDAEHDLMESVLRDLAVLGTAVRGARFCLAHGAAARAQLALAIEAGERAHGRLVELLDTAVAANEDLHVVSS